MSEKRNEPSHVTFDDISALNKERMTALGIHPRVRTSESALMQMMSCVGELAALAYRAAPLTTFEQEEVSSVLGSIAVHLSTLGEAYKVNIGDAAIQRINQQISRYEIRKRCASPPPLDRAECATINIKSPEIAPVVARTTPPPQPLSDAEEHVLMSPNSRRLFFPQLDSAAKFAPAEFNKLNLKWQVPAVDGKMVDVVAGGGEIPLTHDQLDVFMRAVQPFRESHTLLQDAPPAILGMPASLALKRDVPTASAAHPVVKHVDVPAPPGYDAVAVEKMFSPTHFERGLFSPHSTAKSFDIQYSEEAKPTTAHDFHDLVSKIESNEIPKGRVGSLRLRFCMPTPDGKVVELMPNGSSVPVSTNNIDEFLRLVRERSSEQQGRVRRTESIKRIDISNAAAFDPSAERQKFSPTHFEHNIFAPHEERKQFFVDYDNEEDCLPEALRQGGAPGSSPVASQPRKTELPSGDKYVDYIRSRGVEGFRGIIEQIGKNAGMIKNYGVTWCMPSALTGVLDADDSIYDLIVDGRRVPVDESHVGVFLAMVHKFL